MTLALVTSRALAGIEAPEVVVETPTAAAEVIPAVVVLGLPGEQPPRRTKRLSGSTNCSTRCPVSRCSMSALRQGPGCSFVSFFR